jgi:methionyl-tRNA synthetase
MFPAFLMALDMELPKTVIGHGHWTMDHQKMSKTKGNVVDPFTILGYFGVDAIRYYMALVAGNFRSDSGVSNVNVCGWRDHLTCLSAPDWSELQILKHYNHDLRGIIGNLLSRVTAPKLHDALAAFGLNSDPSEDVASYISLGKASEEDLLIKSVLEGLPSRVEHHFANFEIGKALEAIYDALDKVLIFHSLPISCWKVDGLPNVLCY